jgi:sigma-B regulation protein RsbU (phosphoserine phosphatase)
MASQNVEAKTVVVVDDNEQILATTAAYLKARGVNVVTSESALGVSALVRRHQPSVIVLDVMMPALDGDALATLLRSQPNARETPIIFYSAMEEEQVHRMVKKTPGASYVPKADGLPALYSAIMARW